MSAVLIQISVAIGGVAFLISLAVGLIAGVTMLTAIYRSVIVMMMTTLIVALFFRFFTSVLYRFVKEKVVERTQENGKENNNTPSATGTPPSE
jgi:ABC-type dipeptide/oligopeptide/nickel transport system permease subunit